MKLTIPPVVILAPETADHILGTQDIGIDASGAVLSYAFKQGLVRPLRHGEVTAQQFQNALDAGYDLLMLVTEPPTENAVVITEEVLILNDASRAKAAQDVQHHPAAHARVQELTNQALQLSFGNLA